MNDKNQKKFYRCHLCGSLSSEDEINENGKIKCNKISFVHLCYRRCYLEFNVGDYNAFVENEDEGNSFFKKFLPAKHWV